ncbi:major facilitator superfamily MFS_1 [Chondromyces apiculatus DSM 436]|uniref:Major facilitator superfamily MFS_1 n=1 Tax=Chondromyces apiculatus DSM 436 TaxID=1192034 RepID=A0A017T8Z8_9BACT|nr:major facilitator superfamily MFS_1 [Chondromyces apiculatus DSM 436]
MLAIFCMNGAVVAHWYARIPAVKERLQASDGALGLVLLAPALGAMICMPIVGALTGRLGSRRLTLACGVFLSACTCVLATAPSLPLLALALLAWGGGGGGLDVSMNGQGVAIERTYGRPIMSSFHAAFSGGGMAGAVIGGRLADAGISPEAHLLGAGLFSMAVILAASRFLLRSAGKVPVADAAGQAPPGSAWPPRWLLSLGIIGLCCFIGEGAMAEWSAVYLRQNLGTSEAYATTGFAAFSLMMAVGRLCGDRLTQRFGPRALVASGGWLAASSLGIGLLLGTPLAAVIACGCVGAGLSTVAPLAFGAAGRNSDNPGRAIATVTTVSYFGFFLGPPLIGLVSQAFSLRVGLGVVVVGAMVFALLAGARSSRLGGPPRG